MHTCGVDVEASLVVGTPQLSNPDLTEPYSERDYSHDEMSVVYSEDANPTYSEDMNPTYV